MRKSILCRKRGSNETPEARAYLLQMERHSWSRHALAASTFLSRMGELRLTHFFSYHLELRQNVLPE